MRNLQYNKSDIKNLFTEGDWGAYDTEPDEDATLSDQLEDNTLVGSSLAADIEEVLYNSVADKGLEFVDDFKKDITELIDHLVKTKKDEWLELGKEKKKEAEKQKDW